MNKSLDLAVEFWAVFKFRRLKKLSELRIGMF